MPACYTGVSMLAVTTCVVSLFCILNTFPFACVTMQSEIPHPLIFDDDDDDDDDEVLLNVLRCQLTY